VALGGPSPQAPLRLLGDRALGRHDESRFVWIVGHENFSEANAAFYNSPERSALEPQIPNYLDNVEAWMLDSVVA